jgi:hypothetical protein
MTATGAEICEFYDNHWPEGYYHDDCEIEISDGDGKHYLDPCQKYDLTELGVLVADGDPDNRITFQTAFLRWKKTFGKRILVAIVPAERVEDLMAVVKEWGGRVVW